MTITIAEHGRSDEIAERCLDGFLELHPENGPVVTQNPENGHLTITIALDATDPWAAANLGSEIFGASLAGADIPPVPVLDFSVTAVELEDSSENVRALVPA